MTELIKGNISNIIAAFIGAWMIYKYRNVSKQIKNRYQTVLDDIKINIGNRSFEFENEYICSMYDEFNDSLKGNIANINTQVIIEKHLNELSTESKISRLSIKKWEGILSYMPSLATTLGLLGTFLGLTFAIIDTSAALQISNSGLDANVLEQLKSPISAMGFAFGTSIVGIVVSIIINLMPKDYKYIKQSIIDEIENCFDNIMSRSEGPDYNAKIDSFIGRMENALSGMAKSVTDSLENNMGQLVNKINGVGDEIRVSSKNMTDSMQILDGVIRNFELGALKFSSAVDKYEAVCTTAATKLEEVNVALVDSVDSYKEYFNDNVLYFEKSKEIFENSIKQVLEDNKTYLQNAVQNNQEIIESNSKNIMDIINSNKTLMESLREENKEYLNSNIEEIKQTFEKLDESVNSTYKNLDQMVLRIDEMMREINLTTRINSEFIEKNASKMEDTNEKLHSVVSELGVNIKGISDTVGQSMSNNMEDSVKTILQNMSIEFNKIFGDLKDSVKILKDNAALQKDTINSIIKENNDINELVLKMKEEKREQLKIAILKEETLKE